MKINKQEAAAPFFRRFSAVITAVIAPVLLLVLLVPGRAWPVVVDRIVAVINGEIITLSELNAAAALADSRITGDDTKGAEKDRAVKKKILDNLVEEKLIKQASDRAGIDVSEKEIDNAVEEIKKQNKFTKDQLLLALANSGLTYSEYRERLKEQIREVKFMNARFRSKISIQPEEIEDYYRRHKEQFRGPDTFRIRIIYIDAANKDAVELKLKYINEGLARGEGFAELARQYSDGPYASSGGDLGYVKTGEIDGVLEKESLKLKVGGISPPVEKSEGIYIIKLEDRKAGQPASLEKAKGLIYDKLYNKALDEMVQVWLKDAKKVSQCDIRF